MNELLAIVMIVVVCCAIFCAWLLSMATCPDKMVDWLNGTAGTSTCSTSYESKELINKNEQKDPEDVIPVPELGSAFTGLNVTKNTSKKLSVVPEQDEQLTVTSISQIIYPTTRKDSTTLAEPNQLEGYFKSGREENSEVVVIDSAADQSYQNNNLSNLPVRYHYSAPVIHVA